MAPGKSAAGRNRNRPEPCEVAFQKAIEELKRVSVTKSPLGRKGALDAFLVDRAPEGSSAVDL